MIFEHYIRMDLSKKLVDLWPVTQITKPINTNLLRTADNFFIRPHLRYSYTIYLHTYHYFVDKNLNPFSMILALQLWE